MKLFTVTMPEEKIDKLNDRNSLIFFCVANYKVVYLVCEDRRHILVLYALCDSPRCKKLTPKILKHIVSVQYKSARVSKTPLIFTEPDKIEDTILRFMEPFLVYPQLQSHVKWYYTVSLNPYT